MWMPTASSCSTARRTVTTVTAKTLRISRSKISKGGAVVEATAPLFSSCVGIHRSSTPQPNLAWVPTASLCLTAPRTSITFKATKPTFRFRIFAALGKRCLLRFLNNSASFSLDVELPAQTIQAYLAGKFLAITHSILATMLSRE